MFVTKGFWKFNIDPAYPSLMPFVNNKIISLAHPVRNAYP